VLVDRGPPRARSPASRSGVSSRGSAARRRSLTAATARGRTTFNSFSAPWPAAHANVLVAVARPEPSHTARVRTGRSMNATATTGRSHEDGDNKLLEPIGARQKRKFTTFIYLGYPSFLRKQMATRFVPIGCCLTCGWACIIGKNPNGWCSEASAAAPIINVYVTI
jgi:hypothetical protein